MSDLITGMLIGGALAATIHYVQLMILAHRIQSMRKDIAKMVIEHALKDDRVQ